ncbi:HAD family hydrolase [Pseudomonas anguilliseptica]|uniref:HAD family hydrolase n=1 Tax=Pseudomonas anguilliseptica TaxID=53406 RepID=UPI0022AF492E|nr:HAD family hydrolase [Pseudomonas anguilliseptica]MCZ4324354.1 HAD-IB family hydrolase [Pseudomonas anguilliseptica]
MKKAPDNAGNWSAFFDVDGTLISIKSMFSFLDYLIEALLITDLPRVKEYQTALRQMITNEQPREAINSFYYRIYEGLDVERVRELGRDWYAQVSRDNNLFFARMREEISWHQRQGASIVLVSGSFAAILEPLAEELGADFLIAAPLEILNGRYTGHLTGHPSIGQGKADAVQAFIREHQLLAQRCYAYGDDISDIPMLEQVGYPVMVNPDANSRSLCQQRNWNIIEAA